MDVEPFLELEDEVQKVEGWSDRLKALWDAQQRERTQLKVVVLGSSSLSMQQGLSGFENGQEFLEFTAQLADQFGS